MIPLICKRCGYAWNYTGKRYYTGCPKCRTTVKVKRFDANAGRT